MTLILFFLILRVGNWYLATLRKRKNSYFQNIHFVKKGKEELLCILIKNNHAIVILQLSNLGGCEHGLYCRKPSNFGPNMAHNGPQKCLLLSIWSEFCHCTTLIVCHDPWLVLWCVHIKRQAVKVVLRLWFGGKYPDTQPKIMIFLRNCSPACGTPPWTIKWSKQMSRFTDIQLARYKPPHRCDRLSDVVTLIFVEPTNWTYALFYGPNESADASYRNQLIGFSIS